MQSFASPRLFFSTIASLVRMLGVRVPLTALFLRRFSHIISSLGQFSYDDDNDRPRQLTAVEFACEGRFVIVGAGSVIIVSIVASIVPLFKLLCSS